MQLPRRVAAVTFIGCLLLPATRVEAQKRAFLESFVAFHSALFGTYGDEGTQVAGALDRMDESLDAWEQAQAAGETALAGAAGTPVERARFYAEHGRLDEATRAITRAIDADPGRAALHIFHGLLLEATGRRPEAAATFLTASLVDPADPVAAYLAASRLSGDAPETLEPVLVRLMAAARRSGPAAVQTLMRIELLSDSSAPSPMFAPVAYARGFAAFAERRFRDAISHFRSALHADPLLTDAASRDAGFRAGAAALRGKRTREAIDELESAVNAFPGSSEAHRLLGLAYRSADRRSDAVRHLNAAVRLAPDDERARVLLGMLLTELGDLTEAERVLQQTIRAMPESGQARWALAVVFDLQNRGLEALALLEEAAALPVIAGKAALHYRIAQLAYRHQDHERVINALARRAQRVPNNPTAHKDLGFAYLRVGRDEEALAELLMTRLLGGEDAETLTAIGRIHLAAERFDDAERVLRRATTLDPANAQANYALGNTLIRIGKTAEGGQYLDAYARIRSSTLADERRQFESPMGSPR
jgi:tetratricopeptide (TPR) repeat protein